MNRKKLLFLSFAMGGANFLANLVGATFVQVVSVRVERPLPDFVWDNPLVAAMDILFTPMAFVFIIVATHIYNRPMRAYLKAVFRRTPVEGQMEELARRRLLNEPYITMALDLSMWGLAALFYGLVLWQAGAGVIPVRRAVFNSLSIGLITITIAFFLQEHVLQNHLVPHFFPQGGLSAVPGARRIRIGTRLAALLLASNLLPLLSIMLLYWRIVRTQTEPQAAIEIMKSAIITYALVFIAVGVVLTILVSRNLSRPFAEIIDALHEIRGGRFDQKVRVTSNDEIGYTGDAINEMTQGLKERERMRQALDLAMEVQQNLLPKSTPQIAGLDVAGASVYCEETGGDYFDYFEPAAPEAGTLQVAVGDVSEHGIASAMLMTTVRAALRQRLRRDDLLDDVVADVNRQLARDVEDSGRFATLFLADIDRRNQRLRWVNAGHDTAMVYTPATESFFELGRTGLPIGVTDGGGYVEKHCEISPGQIIVIGTDGIWEARNPHAEMFGKPRLREAVRRLAGSPAEAIVASVLKDVDAFCRPLPPSDDITLMIVKIEALARDGG
jgi:sigma-B regulation protein RsbU (phosphoserine phosphatase)